jgi:ABC-2 type transport system ATP-binding protein
LFLSADQEGNVSHVAVELDGVFKRFRRRERVQGAAWWRWRRVDKLALAEVHLTIPVRSVTGIIGRNGSGKSTLVRILATLLVPDGGVARVFGHDVVSEAAAVRRHVNRVSVEASFFKELSPWENMVYAARLYGDSGADLRGRVEGLLGRLGLPLDTLDRPMKQLSRGQQQKVAVARSFLSSPNLLLMDEPTTGLDPRSRREVQHLVEQIRREREVTVLLCTHDLVEAESLCDRVLLMDAGRVLADGTPRELSAAHSAANLEDVFLQLSGQSLVEEA